MANCGNAELYEKHAEELTRFAAVVVGPSMAPDVVSEAVLRAMNARAWPKVSNKRAYLYRSVFNEAKAEQRSFVRRRRLEERVAPSEAVLDAEPSVDVVKAIVQLSPRQRAVIYLSYWEDLTTEEIAALLSIGVGSVHRHLARARARLRRMLDD